MRLAFPAITGVEIQRIARPLNTAILHMAGILLFAMLVLIYLFCIFCLTEHDIFGSCFPWLTGIVLPGVFELYL